MAVPLRAAAAAIVLLIPLGGAASGASPASFADPTGDGKGGPDVIAVSASASATDVTFEIHTAGGAWDGWSLDLLVDSDANYATGHSDGVDHDFTFRTDRPLAATRWDGTAFVPYPSAATAVPAEGTLTITVPRGELAGTPKLAFAVVAFGGGAIGDQAPDGSFAPGTPPRWVFSPGAAQAVSLSATFVPTHPVHGSSFAVASVTERLATGATRVTRSAACTARVNGARLPGRCRWRLPARSRGRRLAVSVSADGTSHRYAFVIR